MKDHRKNHRAFAGKNQPNKKIFTTLWKVKNNTRFMLLTNMIKLGFKPNFLLANYCKASRAY